MNDLQNYLSTQYPEFMNVISIKGDEIKIKFILKTKLLHFNFDDNPEEIGLMLSVKNPGDFLTFVTEFNTLRVVLDGVQLLKYLDGAVGEKINIKTSTRGENENPDDKEGVSQCDDTGGDGEEKQEAGLLEGTIDEGGEGGGTTSSLD